jgi:hypothetical protein
MPFSNLDNSLDDLTLDQDLADNMILALDRGSPPRVHTEDSHPYMIKRLTTRMRMSDYDLLPPQVKMNYEKSVEFHERAEADKQAKILAAKNEYIPTSGGMIACDVYVPDPKNPLSSKRLRVPQDALNWLMKQMELQGNSVKNLEEMDALNGSRVVSEAAQIARNLPSGQMGPGNLPPA